MFVVLHPKVAISIGVEQKHRYGTNLVLLLPDKSEMDKLESLQCVAAEVCSTTKPVFMFLPLNQITIHISICLWFGDKLENGPLASGKLEIVATKLNMPLIDSYIISWLQMNFVWFGPSQNEK